jgi:hypothetical protein
MPTRIFTRRKLAVLTDRNDLGMKEVVGSFTGKKIGATFFRGSKPIDGVWATLDVDVVSACVMPVGYGIGDHRMLITSRFRRQQFSLGPLQVKDSF